jgi:hypothetical protein
LAAEFIEIVLLRAGGRCDRRKAQLFSKSAGGNNHENGQRLAAKVRIGSFQL